MATDADTSPSNPIGASGTGLLYGADVGYQFNSHFAVEGEVIEMPTSNLNYSYNLYTGNPTTMNEGMTFSAITFKVIAPFFYPNLSIFADAGPAYQYLSSPISNIDTFAPTFGGGFMYRLAQHWQAEVSFQYAPGTGKSVVDPMYDYVPELYMGTFKIDYIF